MKKNKGFSLIELLVVIGIMAVLVGVIAPQLMKYMKKSKVAADKDQLSEIFAATVYAMLDPDISQEPDSQAIIQQMTEHAILLESIPEDSTLGKEIMDTMRWTSLDQSYYIQFFKLARPDSHIYVQNYGSIDKPITMWITHTDETCHDYFDEAPADWTDIHYCISIRQEEVH